MPEIIGRQIEAGVALEASRGTAESTAGKWLRKVTANLMERAEKVVDDTTMGVLEDSVGSRVVKKFIEGDIDGILHIDALGYFLKNLYGTVNTTTVSGSVKQHAFTMLQSIEHPALSVFIKRGGVDQKVYNGGMLKSFELRAAVDDYLRFTASFLARQGASNADTPTYGADYDFIGKDVTVKVAASEAGLAGATALGAKEVTVTWDTGLVADHILGSYFPDDIYNTKMSIEGSLTLNFKDATQKDLYLGDDAKYMSISIVGAADLGSSNYPTITLIFHKVMFQDWGIDGGADDVITENITFKAFYNRVDGKQSTVTIKNLTATY